MRHRTLPICLVSIAVLSCSTITSDRSDALEVLRKIESSLLQTPGLAATVEREHHESSLSLVSQDGVEYREAWPWQYVVKRGNLYWVWEGTRGDIRDIPIGGLGMSPVVGTSALDSREKTTGRTLIDVLHPWGLVAPLSHMMPEEHIISTSLLTAFLADARLGHDADGPFLVCRFRVEEAAYLLPKEYWNRTIIGGVDLGPPKPMTGTAEQKLWYDPLNFCLRKRTIAGEFSLDGGKTHTLPPVGEVYTPRPGGEWK